MKPANCYLILGVAKSDSADEIRRAYLRLARKLHPDRAGAHSTRAFQEISEAYATLSDPVSRRRHDARLARARQRGGVAPRAVVVPLDPDARGGGSPQGDWGAATSVRPPGGSSSDSRFGWRITLVPAPRRRGRRTSTPPRRCLFCGGRGQLGPFLCPACSGRG